MALTATLINDLIIERLTTSELRLLALTVSVRKGLSETTMVRGDLSATVRAALRRLEFSERVVETDGVYALTPTMRDSLSAKRRTPVRQS